MKLDDIDVSDLKQGYQEQKHGYSCVICGAKFSKQEVYPVDAHFLTAEAAMKYHIHSEHSDRIDDMILETSRYNTLTDHQKQLFQLFAQGKSDKEIAQQLNLSASTVRHQKFMFREKYKQAKFYLALYENVFIHPEDLHLMEIHEQAPIMDDRFIISDEERETILAKRFASLKPLKLASFPAKEKSKIVILTKICELFESERTYTEAEINKILKEVYDDYVTLRRYLIEYRYLERNKDGSAYWLTK